MLVAEHLISSYGFEEISSSLYRRSDILLKLIDEKHIYADGLGEDLEVDLVIVASSHRSEAGVKALLTHPVGNWGSEARMGGSPRTLSATSARALYTSLNLLKLEAEGLRLDDWRVGLEVTHHGPRTCKPLIFVEAGGPSQQIHDRRVIEAIASVCVGVAESRLEADRVAVGFGGGHYAPTFTRLSLKRGYAFGHICPKYAMPIDEKMVEEAFRKTIEHPRLAVIDWKGVKGAERSQLIELIEDLGYEWEKA